MLTSLDVVALGKSLSADLNDPSIATRITNNADSIAAAHNSLVSSSVSTLGNSTLATAKSTGLVNNLDIKSGLVPTDQVSNILSDNSASTITEASSSLLKDIQSYIPEHPIDAITTSVGDAVDAISSSSVVTSISDFATSVFDGSALDSLFSGIDISSALDNIEKQFTSGIASKSKNLASKYDLNNPTNQDKLNTVSNGFTDPNAKYPTGEYKDKPDTNKLATGDINGTIVVEKEKDRLTGSKLPGGDSWEMPTSSYNAKYPYNTVTQTESGHIIEFDDTPGSERIHIYHKSGTYLEIDPNGTSIQRAKGSKYDVVDKNANISIGSDAKIHVGGDLIAEVDGDIAIRGQNDIGINAGGRLQLSANEGIDLHSKDIKIEADNELHLLADVKAFITAEVMRILSNQDIAIQATTDINIKAANISSQADSNVSSKGDNILMQSATDTSIKAGNNFVWDTGNLTLGEQGSSQDVADSQPSEAASNAEIGVGDPRVDLIPTNIPEPQSRNFLDEYATYVETSNDNYSALKTKLTTAGLVPYSVFDKTPIIINTDSSAYSGIALTNPSTLLTNTASAPDNFQLTTNFTLSMLTTKTALHHSSLVAQSGLSYGQILSNLQLLCVNILEPLYAVYPDLEVISCFNQPSDYQVNSDHYTGNAVDIQFKNQDIKDYYKIAVNIKSLIPYDLLSLNYSDYSNKPWIHISLKSSGNRNINETWYNNKQITSDLSELT